MQIFPAIIPLLVGNGVLENLLCLKPTEFGSVVQSADSLLSIEPANGFVLLGNL